MRYTLIARSLASTLALTSLAMVANTATGSPAVPNGVGLTLVSNFLVALVLTLVASSAQWRGAPLSATIFILFFGVYYFDTMILSLFYRLDTPFIHMFATMVAGLFVSLSSALVIVWMSGGMRSAGFESVAERILRSPLQWAWRVLVCEAAYVAVGFVVGTLVSPFVSGFTAPTGSPSTLEVLLMHGCLGLVYVGLAIPFVSMMRGTRLSIGLSLGATISVLGGIAPLLPPNPFLPAAFRFTHMLEAGIANFVYGLFVGYFLSADAGSAPMAERKAA